MSEGEHVTPRDEGAVQRGDGIGADVSVGSKRRKRAVARASRGRGGTSASDASRQSGHRHGSDGGGSQDGSVCGTSSTSVRMPSGGAEES